MTSFSTEDRIRSKLRPLGDLVLVERDPPYRSQRGLFLPDQAVEGRPTAMVIRLGSACKQLDDVVGKRVVLGGLGRRIGDTRLWLIDARLILLEVPDGEQVEQPLHRTFEPYDEHVA